MKNIRQIKEEIAHEIIIYDHEGDLFYHPLPKFDKSICLKLSSSADIFEEFWLVLNPKNMPKIDVCEKSNCSYSTGRLCHMKRHKESCTDVQTFREKQVRFFSRDILGLVRTRDRSVQLNRNISNNYNFLIKF